LTKKYINALLTGENKVINEIYAKLYPKIKSYILSNKGKQEDALDVFHDALIYIIVTQKEKETTIISFEAYFFTICKNLWKKTLKKRVIKSDVITLTDKETDLSLFILEQKRFDFYIEKFNLLSKNCKEILGSYFNGLSYEDILTDLNYATINTVRQRVYKCRTKLIKLIKSDKQYEKIKKWGEI
jgi:RNA polymerase sigma factor (sigma-70 family)